MAIHNSIVYDRLVRGLEQLDQNRGDFSFYYVRPVYFQNGFGSIQESFPETGTEIPETLHFEVENRVDRMKSDFVVSKLSKNYGIATGTLEKKSLKFYNVASERMKDYGIVPVYIPKLTLFNVAMKPFEDYMLKEFRAGAEQQQSYFKDHRVPGNDYRRIENRLEQDRAMGLLPYRTAFAIPKKGLKTKTVEVFSNGLFITNYLKENINFITEFLERVVIETKARFEESAKVKVSQNKWSKQYLVKADLEVGVEPTFYDQQFDTFSKNAESLVEPKFYKIGRLFDVENKEGAFHSIFASDSSENATLEAHYTIDIEKGKISISPVYSKNNLWYVTKLLHTIDSYFPIQKVKAV
jgi:hypothetical protein